MRVDVPAQRLVRGRYVLGTGPTMNTGATAIIHNKEEEEHVPAMAAAGAVMAVGQIINPVHTVAAAEVVNQNLHSVRQAAVLLPVHQAAVQDVIVPALLSVLERHGILVFAQVFMIHQNVLRVLQK